MLWSKSKRLLDVGKIDSFYVSSVKIKIRILENSKLLAITHVEDFKKYFPDVDLMPSSWRKLLTSIYLISSSADCCVTTIHSYYGLFKDSYHGYCILCWNQPVYFQLKPTDWNPWKACLLSLYCSTLYVVIGFLQFVTSYLFKLYLV